MSAKTTDRIILELCIASVEDAVIARAAGADRVELNAALMLGGLTPSLGTLIEVKKAIDLPVIVMVRPRDGGFCYSQREFQTMQLDVQLALEHGADGIAFGILTPDGQIDMTRCRQLIEPMVDRQIVFHRAFDVVVDPHQALQQLIDLGVTRVLTSGQEATAYDGAAMIAELIERADDRIEILPGGGINRFTLADVLRRTGCNQVHGSLRTTQGDASSMARPHVSFGGSLKPPEDRFGITSATAVTQLRELLDG